MIELKACPFCGKTGSYSAIDGFTQSVRTSWVICDDKECPNHGRVFTFDEWQSRPIEDTLLARAEKAEGELRDIRLIANEEITGEHFTEEFEASKSRSTITMRESPFARFFIEEMTRLFYDSGCTNYLEIQMCKPEPDGSQKEFVITIQNKDGKSPDQLKQEAIERAVKAESSLAELREQTRWIPVTERLPEDKQQVEVITRYDRCRNRVFRSDDEGQWWEHTDDNKCDELEYITHWRPIDLPDEDKESEE